jgi:hypothetical protein
MSALSKILLGITVLSAGCATPFIDPDWIAPADESSPPMGPAANPETVPAETRDWSPKSTLYARDGTVVSPAGGTPAEPVQDGSSALPTHDLQRTGNGRMYILELYQNVIEERDALSMEISTLNGVIGSMRQTMTEADRRIAELEGRIASLETDKQTLVDENLELAGRLTTAQIRRLQAEKILLESQLAIEEPDPAAPASETP